MGDDSTVHSKAFLRWFLLDPSEVQNVILPTAAKQLIKSSETALCMSVAHVNKDGQVMDETQVRSCLSSAATPDGVYRWDGDAGVRLPLPEAWSDGTSYFVLVRLHAEELGSEVSHVFFSHVLYSNQICPPRVSQNHFIFKRITEEI
jgi:hypothetical protein